MQHPDEGTIHAWLDGALSAEDARAFEAHMAECAGCAAAVTEARGLLAASSRILSALDSVPGGVLPAAEPELARDERVIPIGRSSLWRSPGLRAAAAILLVGSVSWLATRSTGKQAEGNVASPTEAPSAVVYDTTSLSSARVQADTAAPASEQSTPPSAPSVAQSAPRRAARENEQRSMASGAAANANQAVVPPAPAPQVAAPQALPYAMPRLAESPNAGAVTGAGGREPVVARSAAPTAQAAAADADANAAPRMMARAPGATSGALLRTEAVPTLNADAKRLAGCYRLETAGPGSEVALLPARVELVPDLLSPSDTSSRVLRPAPGSPPFATGAKAAWSVIGPDLLRLQLGEGPRSVDARLELTADSLHGRAELRNPLIRGSYTASEVRGSRTPCPAP